MQNILLLENSHPICRYFVYITTYLILKVGTHNLSMDLPRSARGDFYHLCLYQNLVLIGLVVLTTAKCFFAISLETPYWCPFWGFRWFDHKLFISPIAADYNLAITAIVPKISTRQNWTKKMKKTCKIRASIAQLKVTFLTCFNLRCVHWVQENPQK